MSHLRAVSKLLGLVDRAPVRFRPILLGALSPALLITPGPVAWLGLAVVLLLSLRTFGWLAVAVWIGATLVTSVAGAVAGAVYTAFPPAQHRASRARHFARCFAGALAGFSVIGAAGAVVTARWLDGGFGFGVLAFSVIVAALFYGSALGWITFESEDPYGALAGR